MFLGLNNKDEEDETGSETGSESMLPEVTTEEEQDTDKVLIRNFIIQHIVTLRKYSQLLPCGHLTITDIRITWTAAKFRCQK